MTTSAGVVSQKKKNKQTKHIERTSWSLITVVISAGESIWSQEDTSNARLTEIVLISFEGDEWVGNGIS